MTARGPAEIERDREEILRIHGEWWLANQEMSADRARKVLVGNGKSHEFGLTGHTYTEDDVDQYKPTYEVTGPIKTRNVRVTINGDVGWLICDATIDYRALVSSGTGASLMQADESGTSLQFRATEIYMRDDGEGNSEWRLWHSHYSQKAPADEPRPGLDH